MDAQRTLRVITLLMVQTIIVIAFGLSLCKAGVKIDVVRLSIVWLLIWFIAELIEWGLIEQASKDVLISNNTLLFNWVVIIFARAIMFVGLYAVIKDFALAVFLAAALFLVEGLIKLYVRI